MRLLTRNTDYAIRSLCFIAKSEKRHIPVTELAGSLKIPKPFLRKILQILNRERLLRSYRGKGGGFALARPPEAIPVIDVMEIFQEPLRLNGCFFKKMRCPDIRNCALKKKIASIERHIVFSLTMLTIASLLPGEG